ncbi:GNAT family N-acetyltransferase [Gorillibacterium sp. sgz500922]|uniref:GNAT family N-acetyltransferase n=1 Tax=Gorillibacterium sp. sgz500922 TaxID=3446694 RepID=UPI003F664413
MTKNNQFATGTLRIPEGMDPETVDRVAELAAACEAREDIQLKLHKTMMENRRPGAKRDFLWEDTEGRLIGYLGLNSFEPDSAEVVGLVHPDRRREGIFRNLFQAGTEEALRQGFRKLILISPERSLSGKGYIGSLGLKKSFSEYVMDWSEEAEAAAGSAQARTELPAVSLRHCSEADRELVILLDMRGFDMTREATEAYVDEVLLNSPDDRIYAAFREDGEPAGKISIQMKAQAAHLFGFSVLPELRGQGLGRAILREAIRLARTQGCTSYRLEVECENDGALGLYRSCGFRETAVQDYYNYIIPNGME